MIPTVQRLNFPPGPPPITGGIVGQVRFGLMLERDVLGVIGNWFERYGPFIHLQLGDKLHLFMVSDADIMHEIVVKQAANFVKDPTYTDKKRGLARFLGNGLIVSDGEFWKRQRRLVAPALHVKRVESYAEAMVELALRHLERWYDGMMIDVDDEMMALTLAIVARTLFNSDVSGDAARVGRAMTILQHVGSGVDLLPVWVPTPKHVRERWAVSTLDRVIARMIVEWRAEERDRGDLFSMLLLAQDEDGTRMDDRQVRDETATLMLAGHETTANALNWTWYLLAQHPEAEAKLHHELDSVLEGRSPALDDLKRLPYTEQVIKESMRLYPPAWGFGRMAAVDTQVGGYDVPKGSIFNLATLFMHRSPRYWDAPLEFRPERFSPENEARLPKGAYLPFGGGPRVCIGNSFAMMEARLLLAAIASRYRLRLASDTKVEPDPLITLRPKGGIRMRLERR